MARRFWVGPELKREDDEVLGVSGMHESLIFELKQNLLEIGLLP